MAANNNTDVLEITLHVPVPPTGDVELESFARLDDSVALKAGMVIALNRVLELFASGRQVKPDIENTVDVMLASVGKSLEGMAPGKSTDALGFTLHVLVHPAGDVSKLEKELEAYARINDSIALKAGVMVALNRVKGLFTSERQRVLVIESMVGGMLGSVEKSLRSMTREK